MIIETAARFIKSDIQCNVIYERASKFDYTQHWFHTLFSSRHFRHCWIVFSWVRRQDERNTCCSSSLRNWSCSLGTYITCVGQNSLWILSMRWDLVHLIKKLRVLKRILQIWLFQTGSRLHGCVWYWTSFRWRQCWPQHPYSWWHGYLTRKRHHGSPHPRTQRDRLIPMKTLPISIVQQKAIF